MHILTLSELTAICEDLTIVRPQYNNVIADWFTNCFNTGCRPAELFDVSLWSFDGVDTYILNPLKGNLPRYFNESVLTSRLKEWILSEAQLYYFTTLRKQRYYNELWRSVGKIFNGDKEVENYLFRYRYVKQLQADGLSNSDIKMVMGWNHLEIVNNYTNAILYHH